VEEYDDLVLYYSILCTKQQMDDANVESNEWWPMGDGRSLVLRKDAEKFGYT
jgi:hypothetical protein